MSNPTNDGKNPLRNQILQHHFSQHTEEMMKVVEKKKMAKPVFFLAIMSATSLNGALTSKGRGMFTGPIDTGIANVRENLVRLLGQKEELDEHLAATKEGEALLITQIDLDGTVVTIFGRPELRMEPSSAK